MATRLEVDLLPTWSERSYDNPDGVRTYVRHASDNPGALQVSWSSYVRPGPPPQWSDENLIQQAKFLVASSGEEIISQSNGNAKGGRFGCVVANSPEYRTQVWVINKGPEKLLVTHTGPNPPDQAEIVEAEQIAMGICVDDEEPQVKKPSLWQRLRGDGG